MRGSRRLPFGLKGLDRNLAKSRWVALGGTSLSLSEGRGGRRSHALRKLRDVPPLR